MHHESNHSHSAAAIPNQVQASSCQLGQSCCHQRKSAPEYVVDTDILKILHKLVVHIEDRTLEATAK